MSSKLYIYQLQGVLENADKKVMGVRALVCTLDHFSSVDVPAEVFDKELLAYLRFRLAVNDHMDVNKLPYSIQNNLRTKVGRYLDQWVLANLN